jgi:microcystin-dependent protein
MSDPYISEIRLMSFNFPPSGWALCNGQILSIQQNQALFALIGTTYGGDGVRTFALPNLQGQVPLHFNQTYPLGAAGGEVAHNLSTNEIAAHPHTLLAVAAAAPTAPVMPPGPTAAIAEPVAAQAHGATAPVLIYATGSSNTQMAANAVTPSAGGQAHPNQQPFLVMNYCIALEGLFPSRN